MSGHVSWYQLVQRIQCFLQGQPPKEKKRTPAWTDRILYKSPAGLAKQTYYSSANLLVSDHKPVSSRLTLTVSVRANQLPSLQLLLVVQLVSDQTEVAFGVLITVCPVEVKELMHLLLVCLSKHDRDYAEQAPLPCPLAPPLPPGPTLSPAPPPYPSPSTSALGQKAA